MTYFNSKELTILYEDSNLLVLDKPSGLSMHKTHESDQRTSLADLLLERYPSLATVGEDPLRPGIVHRLDKETSGLVLVAKNNETFSYFKGLFQNKKIQKTYIALVYGTPKNAHGVIEATLGKIGTKQTTQLKGKRVLKERDAVTEYNVLKQFSEYALLEVSPKTGRTHQIRVHLKSIGHPIVGDPLYGPRRQKMPGGLTRLFLHAQRLAFTTPDGKALTLEADLPEDLQKIISGLL